MSQLTMWSMIVGFLSPYVIALVQQPKWNHWVRSAVTAVCCIILGGGTAYFNNQFNLHDIVGSVLLLGVSAITFYEHLLKPSVRQVELGTSPKHSRAVGHARR